MKRYPNNNHPYETLFKDGDNKIVFCNECKIFHVFYGTTSLDLSKSAMDSLDYELLIYLDFFQDSVESTCRCIEVETPYLGIRLLLSVDDIHRFRKMLYSATLAYEEGFWKSGCN